MKEFAANHAHPVTRARLGSRFVVIRALNMDEAHAEMMHRFGSVWAGVYQSREDAGVDQFKLVPLEGAEAMGACRDLVTA